VCEPAVFADPEARSRIVTAIGREQKPPIPREDDAACALKGVRRALLATDWLESPGTGSTCGHAFDLGKLTAPRPTKVHDSVAGLVRLQVEMPATLIRLTLLCSYDFRDPDNGSP
jgi:hypothetical protein